MWDEDWNGESQVSSYPVTLTEMGKFLYEDDSQLSQDGESIWFKLTDGITTEGTQEKYQFSKTGVYEGELKILYKTHSKKGSNILN